MALEAIKTVFKYLEWIINDWAQGDATDIYTNTSRNLSPRSNSAIVKLKLLFQSQHLFSISH